MLGGDDQVKIIDIPTWDPAQRFAAKEGTVDLVIIPKPNRLERAAGGFWLEEYVRPLLGHNGRLVLTEYTRKR